MTITKSAFTKTLIILATLALAALVGILVGACQQPTEPPPDPVGGLAAPDPGDLSFAVGDTNFTNVVASGDITAGDDLTVTDDTTLGDAVTVTGAATLNGGLTMDTNKFTVADTSGNTTIAGTLSVAGASSLQGNLADSAGAFTIADNTLIDGAADAVQLTVQGYTTQTNSLFVAENSAGTDKFTISNDGNTVAAGTLTVSGAAALNAGITVDTSAFTVADTTGNVATAGTLTVAGVTTVPTDTEHIGLYTVDAVDIITTTDGALWTVGATEIWYIERVVCHVTTNFDCDGDDCTIEIGLTGGDIDGFLDLDDGELQTTDAEISGLPTGWQGFGSTDTRGAFFAAGGGVIMTNDTIDLVLEDNSGSTNPTAGAATCYIIYLRIQ